MKKSNQLMSWVFRSLMVSLIVIFALSSQDSFAGNKKSLSGDEKAAEVKEAFLGIKPPAPLSEERKKKIVKYLVGKDEDFDSEVGLYKLTKLGNKPKWAKKRKGLKIPPVFHQTRWSLDPCFGRIASGDPKQIKRAFKTIDAILSCQVTDPEHKYFGWWPLFLGLPIELFKDLSFQAKYFVAILRYHREVLPPELAARIDTALIRVAKALLKDNKKADRLWWLHNGHVSDIHLLLTLGDEYNIPEVKQRGLERLKKMYELANKQGGFNEHSSPFTEYNSPSYMLVVLDSLLEMLSVKDEAALQMVRELYYNAWEHVAVRYHFPTGEWSGPHGRNYMNLLNERQHCWFDSTLSGKPVLSKEITRNWAMSQHVFQHKIPKSLRHYFTSFEKPREVVQRFKIEMDDHKKHLPHIIGTTYLDDKFSFGTVNRSQMWDQKRNFIVYFGSKKAPSYLRLRFMKGEYDFSAVQYFSVQDKTRALTALNFSINGGDRHVGNDRIKGKFKADNLRLRFEIGGDTTGIKISVPDSAQGIARIDTKDKNLSFFIKAPIASFDGAPCKWASGVNTKPLFQENKKRLVLDLILYDGPEKEFKLKKLKESIIGFAFAISDSTGRNVDMQDVSAKLADGKLVMKWDGLSLTTTTVPDTENTLQAGFDGSVNGVSRREYPVKQ